MSIHHPREDFHTVIKKLGLTNGLKLCLDAGHELSAPASTTTWLDLSGNGYDFFRGSTSGSQSTDPTFNGTVGKRSSGEYWSFDGGDFFEYDAANETWMNNLHKNNAKYTTLAWVYPSGATNSYNGLFGTHGDSSSWRGISFKVTNNNEVMSLNVSNGDGGGGQIQLSTIVPVRNAWSLCGVSLDESTGAGFFSVNNVIDPFSLTYNSPTASNATHTMQIASVANETRLLTSGSRLACFMMWEGLFLTAEQVQAIYQSTRGRYGV